MKIVEKSLKSLEFDKILEKLASFSRLEQSSDLCFGASIYSNISSIEKQLNFTKEAKNILDIALEVPLEFVADVQGIEKSTIGSYLKEKEILDIAKTMRTSRIVRNFLKENAPKNIYAIFLTFPTSQFSRG